MTLPPVASVAGPELRAHRPGQRGVPPRPRRQLAVAVPVVGGGQLGVLLGRVRPCVGPRVISDCHFAAQLNHFIPDFRSYSVAVFLKRQSDLSLMGPGHDPQDLVVVEGYVEVHAAGAYPWAVD